MRKRLKSIYSPIVALIRVSPLLWRVRRDPALRPVLRAHLGWMPLCIFSEPLRWVGLVLTSPWRYRNADQRPESFYAPHLPASPFGEPDDVAGLLERHVAAIRAELDGVIDMEVESPSKALVSRGKWSTFPLIRAAKRIEPNIARCPVTWSVAQQCPLPDGVRGGVYFSILAAGTRIKPHCGPSNLKLRYHLTIHEAEGARIRSGSVWRHWRRDQCLILDDSFEHEVVHDGPDRRVVLIVDCWHRDLTAAERAFLTELHNRWRGGNDENEPAPTIAPRV